MADPNIAAELSHIQALMTVGRFDGALQLCQELVKRAPGEAEAWFHLGSIYLVQDLSSAETALRQAIDLSPDNALYWTNLSLALVGLGKAAEAEQSARRAIAL